MDEELLRLIAQAEQVAKTGERLSLTFARELAKVWRDTDRALGRLVLEARQGSVSAALTATRATVLKTQIRAILTTAGYDTLIVAASETTAEALINGVLSRGQQAQIVELAAPQRQTIDALRQIASLDLLAQGDEAALALWRAVTQRLLTTRPTGDILQDLAAVLDKTEAAVRTLFDTQVSIFGRQVEATATDALGTDQPFLFVGPIDDVTRAWCLERVGKVFSRGAIDEMDNGQLPNVFLTAGGFNCRHSWMAVESRELRELADTGERVEPIAGDVRAIRARKAGTAASVQQPEGPGDLVTATPSTALPADTVAYLKALDPVVKKALRDYTRYTDRYANLNKALWTDQALTKAEAVAKAKLDQAIDQAPVFGRPVTVYRGVDLDSPIFAVGHTLQLKGFQSTSLDPATAGIRAGVGADIAKKEGGSTTAVVLRIRTERGLYLEPISIIKREQEVLLGHDWEYEVTGVQRNTPAPKEWVGFGEPFSVTLVDLHVKKKT